MTLLSDTQLKDLIVLATQRVSAAYDSVDQLVEDPEQSHLMAIAVISALCSAAADFMADHTNMSNGNVAYFQILKELALCGDQRALKQFMQMGREGK